jgi:Fic family protein
MAADDNAPGEYVPYGRREYYSPDDLPPTPPIDTNRKEIQNKIQGAMYELGRVDGLSEETRANPVLFTSMVRREAVESVLVEGGDLELEDIFRTPDVDPDSITKDIQEALNYEQVIHRGSSIVSERDLISLDMIKDFHSSLLEDARDEGTKLGEFREKPAHIPPPDRHGRPFVPPIPRLISGLMSNFELLVVLKRSKSVGSRAEAVIDIFDGTFEREFPELAVPASAG